MVACWMNKIRVALKLLDRHDINVNQVNKGGYTALILASKNKMHNVVVCISSKIIF